MSSEVGSSGPFVAPRPGVVQSLGVFNVVFATLLGLCSIGSSFYFLIAMRGRAAVTPEIVTKTEAPAPPPPTPTAPAPAGPRPMVVQADLLMGMDDPAFIAWSIADTGSGLILNGLMFATGIGLINRKAWGARWWAWGAWAKIARLVLIWAVFIVAVAPKLAEIMARTVLVTLQRQNLPANRLPPLPDLIRIYSIMFLGTGVAMIFLGAIYPAISLWVLSRPGVKAALVEKPPTEPELP